MSDDRYSRQSLIPDWDQEKLKEAKVLILGVGATGSFVATNLVMSGVGKLILVDYDTIELSNLNRQLLFREKDIGKNKAEIAAERLKELNPDVTIEFVPTRMEEMSRSLLEGLTLIACCLDSFRGRRWANSLALKEKVPMVNGGMFAFMGDVQTIIPYESACFECQPLVSQEKLSHACTPLGDKRKELADEKEEVTLPSVATLSSIISGLMSQEILKIIIEVGEVLDNYLFYDGLYNTFTTLKLTRNKGCPICGLENQIENTQALVIPGEQVGDFRQRVALAFGMADPQLMYKGKFLNDESDMETGDGEKIYAIDERLAAPLAITLKVEVNNSDN